MTSGSYEVVTSAVSGHATSVAGLADELRAAWQATGQVTLPGNAYGQTGQQVTSLFNAVAQAGAQALQAGIDALESGSATLRANADAYAAAETGESNVFTGISGQLA